MSVHGSEVFSLGSLLQNDHSLPGSLRSSIDFAVPDKKACTISIFDEPVLNEHGVLENDSNAANFTLPPGKLTDLPVALKARLQSRDEGRTRWINLAGWSSTLVDSLTERYLENHGCLDLADIGNQVLGGPIRRQDGSHFVWIQSSIWYIGHRRQAWSSAQQCGFRLIICLPTPTKAGTVITNFIGKSDVVERISHALTVTLLDNHSMGAEALSCVWVLSYSIMRGIIEQLDLAFHIFDPLDTVHRNIPQMSQLPYMLEQANELARIDRYTSGLSEILGFFDAIQSFQQSQKSNNSSSQDVKRCYSVISERSNLESALAKQKITHAQQLCRTYIKQYESLVQMMLSYSATQIADKLENGSKVGERIAVIGVVLAAIAGLTSPLALLTGYFGMNVAEFTNGGQSSLFEFWRVAVPILTMSAVGFSVLAWRLLSKLAIIPRPTR